jgi:hypothetical protein
MILYKPPGANLPEHSRDEIKLSYFTWQDMEFFCDIIVKDILYLNGSLNLFKRLLSQFSFI